MDPTPLVPCISLYNRTGTENSQVPTHIHQIIHAYQPTNKPTPSTPSQTYSTQENTILNQTPCNNLPNQSNLLYQSNPIQSPHPSPFLPPSSLKPEIGKPPPTAKFQRSSRNIPIRQLRYLPTTITSQIRLVGYFGGVGPILHSNIGIVPSVRRIS